MEYNYLTELYHYGVKGQKWGVRRYQNTDGSLKKGHKKRYGEWPPKKTSKKKSVGAKRVSKGKNFMSKIDKTKAIKAVKTTAAVASGALWLTSAIATGNLAAGANTIAAISSIVSSIPHGDD